MKIIADMGSTHLNNFANVAQHLRAASAAGCWGVKGQICSPGGGNIPFRTDWLDAAYGIAKDLGLEFFCSVWDERAMEECAEAGCKVIKFAHSMRGSGLIARALTMFDTVIVTRSIMDSYQTSGNMANLWVATDAEGKAVYPVTSPLTHSAALYKRFQGVSCHALDVSDEIDAAYKSGAEYFECHTRLGTDSDLEVPDGRFAVTYDQIHSPVEKKKVSK